MLDLLSLRCGRVRAPGRVLCLSMLLEVESWGNCALLRLRCDDTGRAACLRQVPLVRARVLCVTRVLRPSLHVQRILPNQFYVRSLVRLMLRLVSAGHDPADVMGLLLVSSARVACCLLIASDSPSNRKVALHVDLTGGL